MKLKKTSKERGTRREIYCNKQKGKPIGRHTERNKLTNLGQRENKGGGGRKEELN
jgi:hypothetical protein